MAILKSKSGNSFNTETGIRTNPDGSTTQVNQTDPVTLANFQNANPGLTPNSQDYSIMNGATPPSNVVSADTIGTKPIKLPQTNTPTTTGNIGLNVDSTNAGVGAGLSNTEPTNPDKQGVKDLMKTYLADSTTPPPEIAQAKQEEINKKNAAVKIQNELTTMDKAYRDEVKAINLNTLGKTSGALQDEVNRVTDRYNNNRANVSIAYNTAIGDYNSAKETVSLKSTAYKDKLDSEYNAWTMYKDAVYNDMTTSEQKKADELASIKKTNAANLQNAYSKALEAAVANSAPQSVLNSIDTASRAPGATEASIYSAAGSYGVDKSAALDAKYKQAQIDKIYSDIEGSNVQGAVVTLNGKPQNASQSSANGYADRLNESNIIIDSIGDKFTGSFSFGGSLPNILQSGERQSFEQAKRNFVTAVLRRESGAAISPSEFDNEALKYFPQAGDKPEIVIQKSNARNTAINNVFREANVARPVMPGMIVESEGKKYRIASDGETLEQI